MKGKMFETGRARERITRLEAATGRKASILEDRRGGMLGGEGEGGILYTT